MTANTPSVPAPLKIKKPLWRRLLKWTLRLAGVFLVLGIAAYAIVSYWAAKTIHDEIAGIRAAGEPLTFADLDKLNAKVDRAHDAGPYYTAAAELVNVDYEGLGEEMGHEDDSPTYKLFFSSSLPTLPAPPAALAWAHRNLDENKIPLDLLDRGSAMPDCSADIQLQYGMSIALTHLSGPRALLNAASLRTRTLALEDHGDEAVESVISTFGLLRTLDRQPVLVAALVQIAFLKRTCDDAAFVLNFGHPSDAALQKLSTVVQNVHVIQPRQMFVAERVYYLETMRNLIGDPSTPEQPDETPPLPEREFWTHLGLTGRVMIAKCLPIDARYIEAATGDWPGILNAMQKLADKPSTIWDQWAPSFTSSMVTYARSFAIYRSTLVAIQIERYRLGHNNQLPAALADLSGTTILPADPFTGNPLLYVKTQDGYCVMSAGRNRSEDDSRHIDRDADPIRWAERWGIHVRTSQP